MPPDPTQTTTEAPVRTAPPVAFGPAAAARQRERSLIGILTVPELAAAIRLGGELRESPAFAEMCGLACGEAPLAGPWGEAPVVDALRARILRASARDPRATPRVRWDGFLGWAGVRLAEEGRLASAPRSTLRACAAALAAAHGFPSALSALSQPVAPDVESFDVLSLVGMRAALEGRVSAPAVRWLLPQEPSLQREGVRGRPAWACALVALQACRPGAASGSVELWAALAATWSRQRFRAVARASGLAVPPLPWGGPALNAADADAIWLAMGLIRKDPPALERADRPPWPKGWGGPDLRQLEARLGALAGCSVPVAREVFLDDALAEAAVACLAGDVAGASARLVASRPPTILGGARALLERAVARRGSEPEALPELPVSRDVSSLFRKLAHFPDPSVALGTPHTMVEGGRGALLGRLVAEGRAATASAVRTVLDRMDLRDTLSPYWLLPAAPESGASVTRLGEWLAEGVAMPAEAESRAWLRSRWASLLEDAV